MNSAVLKTRLALPIEVSVMFIINNVKKRVVKRRYKSTRKLLVSTADLHSKRIKWLRRVPISLNVFLFEEFKKDKHL